MVPEASHHLIVHAALPTSTISGRFLAEEGPTVHLLGAARELAGPTGGAAAVETRGVVALGDPRFKTGGGVDGASLRSALSRYASGVEDRCLPSIPRTWPALPATGREAKRIAALFKNEPSVVLRGEKANETAFREAARGRRVVHVATHAFFLASKCDAAESAEGTSGDARYVPPLLRSGLVLSRGEAGGDTPASDADGILTAEEITALDLTGTELVVLSACETALGQLAGSEGVYGLRRAFELAGARQLVTSVWPVPDRDALRFMTDFYRAMSAGDAPKDAAAAARRRSLDGLRKRGDAPPPLPLGRLRHRRPALTLPRRRSFRLTTALAGASIVSSDRGA